MTTPIGGSQEYFSYAQLNRVVEAFEGKSDTKSVQSRGMEIADRLDLGKADGKQDVMILPGNIMKSAVPVDADQVAKELQKKGVEVQEKIDILDGVTARLDEKNIDDLKKQGFIVLDDSPRNLLPGIPKVMLDQGESTVLTSEGKNPWDMPDIKDVEWTGAEKLHQQGLTGKGQVIAIIDSGYSHPEKPLVGWKDVVEGKKNPVDPHGHGTHVAGDAIKTAPDADLVAVRVMRPDGSGRPSDIAKGLQWVLDNKDSLNIGTVNMSLGGAPDGYPYYVDPINKVVAKAVEKGLNVVVAGGNSGPDAHTIGSPADAPESLTVGSALNPTTVSTFSSRGPTDDGLKKPDILAPGEFIQSWTVPGSQMDKIATTVETLRRMTPSQLRQLVIAKPELAEALGWPQDIGTYDDKKLEYTAKMSLPPMYKPDEKTLAGPGTSFASPEVAGIVATLRQAVPGAGPNEIKSALMDTAQNMGSQYTHMDQGKGFINAEGALNKLKNGG